MVYRLYIPEDFAALYAIEAICFEPPDRFGQRYMRRLVESRSTITWIAEEEGSMAGFSVADCSRAGGAIFAYIETIEVLPELRHRGVGRELLGRTEASAHERGAEAIWLHVDSQNAGAVRLYEAQGYICEGRKENYYPQGRAALIYRKPLATSSA